MGIVQVNNSFHDQNYLPLSAGFLISYAQKHAKSISDFEFLLPVYKRMPVDTIVDQMKEADLVAFSVYVWNFRISCLVAERLKELKPEITILFGGCHVPSGDRELEKFLRALSFVDFACFGEGEIAFTSFLDNFHDQNWPQVPSLTYLADGCFIKTPTAPRIDDLNEIPSPFLTGIFDRLIAQNPRENWIGLWETNRGCPFKCTFCDWGVGSKKRMANYDLTRLFLEIDWFSKNNVEFIYCCDANFGMYKDRDLAIVNKFAENKKQHGCPEAFSVQNTKNSTDASYAIQKVLTQNGLSKGVLLAFQSLHEPSLKAVKRGNIKLQTFRDLQQRFTREGVKTFSDIILGLPEETYETFTDGVSTLIEMGQHNRIQFNNLSILPNAEMGNLEYQEQYGFEIVETKQVNIHGSLNEWEEDVYEIQQLVIATSAMPREHWVKSRIFAFMTALLHFDKLLQIPCILMNSIYGIRYKDIVEAFTEASTSVLSQATRLFTEKARSIQNGGEEYCGSKDWLNIFWPADEFFFIKLVSKEMLGQFYEESLELMTSILKDSGCKDYEEVMVESVFFNEKLIKVPFVTDDINIELNHNIWDVYKANLVGEKIKLEEGMYNYTIDRSSDSWDSWDDWLKRVVWYGNKKGAYLYRCV